MWWSVFALLSPVLIYNYFTSMLGSPLVLKGNIDASQELTELHVPFDVPVGTTSIQLKFSYTGKDEGNAVDLGILGVDKVFRGYSGGTKSDVFVANNDATPGYIPGLLGAGEWYVLLGVYTIKAPCAYHIQLAFDNKPLPVFVANPAPARITPPKQPFGQRPLLKWLKGDFHMHTIYSDGRFTLDELVAKAQKRGLDFIFSTEHNTYSANHLWGNHAPAEMLVGRGIEVTTRKGHWNAIGLEPTSFIDPRTHTDGELRNSIAEVHKQDGFAILNHPFGECKCCDWDYGFIEEMDAIEVWNGPWKRHPEDQSNEQAVAKWDLLLREGRFFVGTGGSDTHEPKFEVAEPCTHVLADEVSTASIIQSLRRAHAYVTQHPQYEIDFKLLAGAGFEDHKDIDESWQHSSSAGIGDALPARSAVADIVLRGFPTDSEVKVITESGIALQRVADRVRWSVKGRYVRVEIRAADNSMLGLTNPIWLDAE